MGRDDERDAAVVVADALQARGDVRGELLALELAATGTDEVHEARELNRASARLRTRHGVGHGPSASEFDHDPMVVRGGLVTGVELALDQLVAKLQQLDADDHAIRRLSVYEHEQAGGRRLDDLVDALVRRPNLDLLDVSVAPLAAGVDALNRLLQLRPPRALRIGWLPYFSEPNELAKLHTASAELLEALSLEDPRPCVPEIHVGPRLRVLEAHVESDEKLDELVLRSRGGLERLSLSYAGELEALAGLASLRELRVPGFASSLSPLVSLPLERLHIQHSAADPDELRRLPCLRWLRIHVPDVRLAASLERQTALEELGLIGGSVGGYERLPVLPRLRRLSFINAPRSLPLSELELGRQPSLRAVHIHGPVPLSELAELELEELQLTLGVQPQILRRVGISASVRRLTLRGAILQGFDARELAATLSGVEVLTLSGRVDRVSPTQLTDMPRLHTLILEGVGRGRGAVFGEFLPHVLVRTRPAPDREIDPCFDWRASGWPR